MLYLDIAPHPPDTTLRVPLAHDPSLEYIPPWLALPGVDDKAREAIVLPMERSVEAGAVMQLHEP